VNWAMTKEPKKQISLTLDEDLLGSLEQVRRENHFDEVQDAIRMLLSKGLKRYKEEKKA